MMRQSLIDIKGLTTETIRDNLALRGASAAALEMLERCKAAQGVVSEADFRAFCRLLLVIGPHEADLIPEALRCSPLMELALIAVKPADPEHDASGRTKVRAIEDLATFAREPAASANVQVNIGRASPFDSLSTESLAALTRVLAAKQLAGALPAPPIFRQMPQNHSDRLAAEDAMPVVECDKFNEIKDEENV